MGILNHLGHAAQLIREADPERAARWILYALHKELKIKPANHQDPEDYVVATISRLEIQKGVVNKKWDLIDSHIRTAILRGSLK